MLGTQKQMGVADEAGKLTIFIQKQDFIPDACQSAAFGDREEESKAQALTVKRIDI